MERECKVSGPTSQGVAGVRSIERALAVLTAFSIEEPEQTLSAISDRLALARSTTHRLLGTLERWGFVERGVLPGSYRLGPRAIGLGLVAQRTQLLNPAVQAVLEKLRAETAETIGLSTLVGRKLLMIAKAESEHALRYSLAAGTMAPAHSCAGGKVLLADLSPSDLAQLCGAEPLERLTPRTIQSLDVLLMDLAQAQRIGYAVDDEEWVVGLRAIAVPIRGATGRAELAISVCSVTARHDLEWLVEQLKSLREGAAELEAIFAGNTRAAREREPAHGDGDPRSPRPSRRRRRLIARLP
jgi:IclR family acetate operon transcriptional repressor